MPVVGTQGNFDPIFEGEAVGELLFAVSAPDDAIDGDRSAELELDPTFTTLIRNPTVAVADFAIIDVFEAVNIRIRKDAGSGGFRAVGGESDVGGIRSGRVNFEFIDARLSVGGPRDSEAKTFGMNGREVFRVTPGVDGGAKEMRGSSFP